mgnify:CR=1 FL=1
MTKSIHTKEYAYFAEQLRKAREEAGLSQVEVAKKLKRPQSHISNVESGQQRVDVVELNNNEDSAKQNSTTSSAITNEHSSKVNPIRSFFLWIFLKIKFW